MQSNPDPRYYKWYQDRPTVLALISGGFSFVITLLNFILNN